jgi:hypothetical protein
MAPSTESRLPFEGLICPAPEIFPVAGNASDDHHSLVLLIGGPLPTLICAWTSLRPLYMDPVGPGAHRRVSKSGRTYAAPNSDLTHGSLILSMS